MKIVVNTRLLRKNQMDGIGWFTYNTMQYIVRNHPEIEFHFLFDSGIEKDFLFGENVVPHNLFPPAKHALLNIIWFEVSVKAVLKKIEPDLFLSPDGILCLGWKGKQYGVMHDINYHHNPQDLKWSNSKYYNYFFPRIAKKATRLATVSNYSKQDIVNTYHVPPEKIDVVFNGVNDFFRPLSQQERSKTKLRLTGGKDYFLFVGALHPRKNLIRLLQAFDLFKTTTQAPIQLVIAGKPMYKGEEIRQYYQQMEYKHDVVFPGRVPDEEINAVVGSAFALAFVPTFEGFGIPIIEAMQCDVPVICSNTTSMPEVAGDAALLIDPFDVDEIKDAMIRIYTDEVLRKDLVEKGKKRKLFFTWERSAQLLWTGIRKCIDTDLET
jgi:glycosyltransferase involved in cell wall biosynthesis